MATKDSTTAKNRNRKIRQDNLRESLAAGGHIQHVIDIADQLTNLSNELKALDVKRLKAAADLKIKLIDKYLPGLKSVEISGGLTLDDLRNASTKDLEDIVSGS